MATYPKTEAETSNSLMSLADEGPWLSAMASANPSGRVTVTTLGTSTYGAHPIRKVVIRDETVKHPTPVVMFTGMVHGLEGAGRESLFALMRDLAQGASQEWAALRKRFTWVFIPSVNPTGFTRGTNRAWLSATEDREPQIDQLWMELNESRLVQEAFTQHQPVVAVDCHEHDSQGDVSCAMFGTSNPWTRDTSKALFESVMGAWKSASVACAPYVEHPPSPANGNIRALAEYRHAVFLLIETHRTKTPQERVQDYTIALHQVLDWVHDHGDEAVAVSGRSRAGARRALSDRTIPLVISGDIRFSTWPIGYSDITTTSGQWRWQFDSLGVEGDLDWVSLDQPNGYLAARLFHPGLFDPLAIGTPYDPPGPPPPEDGDVIAATVNGVPAMEAHVGGLRVF